MAYGTLPTPVYSGHRFLGWYTTRAGGTKVTTGVSDNGERMRIDATQLTAGAYTLHLQRGEQVKDITLHLGLK